MKFKKLALCACSVVYALSFAACGTPDSSGKSTQLGKPQTATPLKYEELENDGFIKFRDKTDRFAAKFAAAAYDGYESEDNFAVSPVSVYMALSLAAECANGDTRNELLSALGVSYEELQTNFPVLYRSLQAERKYEGKITSMLNLTNSLWVNDGTTVNQPCIDRLSNVYYAYSYSADFKNANQDANDAIRSFVKEQTKGLIDKDFQLSDETLFTLINTLYLKTVWGTNGSDLPFTQEDYAFTAKDGTVTNKKLLRGNYESGKVKEADKYSTFYTSTSDGYKIKFILPKDGYTVDDVFTEQTIAEVNAITNYGGYDSENNISYETRCIFPEYKCGYDDDIIKVLKNNFGVKKFFIDPGLNPDGCDFSTLSESNECYCKIIRHVTDLTVDKTGVEGAAVTVIGMDAATAVGPDVTFIRSDFVLNKAFGFVLTDWYNTTLFSGVVNNI
ncbi:MAG: hypothetical protein K2O62_04005 [Clostridia bacterium]|nr:hypothetical protein [Clostridia bacterium]